MLLSPLFPYLSFPLPLLLLLPPLFNINLFCFPSQWSPDPFPPSCLLSPYQPFLLSSSHFLFKTNCHVWISFRDPTGFVLFPFLSYFCPLFCLTVWISLVCLPTCLSVSLCHLVICSEVSTAIHPSEIQTPAVTSLGRRRRVEEVSEGKSTRGFSE